MFADARVALALPGVPPDGRNVAAALGKGWASAPGVRPMVAPPLPTVALGHAHDPDYVIAVLAAPGGGLARVPRPYVEADAVGCALWLAGAKEALRSKGVAVVAAPAMHLPGRKAHDPGTFAVFNAPAFVASWAVQSKAAARVLVLLGDRAPGRIAEFHRRSGAVWVWGAWQAEANAAAQTRALWLVLGEVEAAGFTPDLVLYQASSSGLVGTPADGGLDAWPEQAALRDGTVIVGCARRGWPLVWSPGDQRPEAETASAALAVTVEQFG